MKVDGNRFRRARLGKFLALLDGLPKGPIRVLDVGGTPSYWQAMSDLWSDYDLRFTIVNLDTPSSDDGPFAIRPGNACDLSEFEDGHFDVVHSNSVVEHVGHWPEMAAMAKEVRRLASRYYVQTPYFWFPVEPHYRAPFFHWLPETSRARLLSKHRLGFRGPAASFDAAMRDIQTVNLLSKTQMRTLFPDAVVEDERVFGLTKSIIAVRRQA